MTRVCRICTESKDITEFYRTVQYVCADCHRKRAKRHQALRSGDKDWIAYSRERYQKHRAKYLARAKVRSAVKKGIVSKPTVCSNCEKPAPLQAHHDDYSKPLDVNWYCDPCHKLKHGKLVFKELAR